MQMNALRSANFLKLSSSSSTRDEYWATSISDGTPAGYCLSQMRSMDVSPLELSVLFACAFRQVSERGLFPPVLAMRQPMASGCAISTHCRDDHKTALTAQKAVQIKGGLQGGCA